MPVFSTGKPIVTKVPLVEVEGLKPGRHTFELVVVDDSGNQSLPARAVVEVRSPIISRPLTHLDSRVRLNIHNPLI